MAKKKIIFAFTLILLAAVGSAQKNWTLEECVQYAVNRNLALKGGLIDLEQSAANELQTKLNLLPTLNGVATHGYNWGQRIDPFTNTFATSRVQTNNFGLSTNLDLFNSFQNQNQIKAGKFQRMASEQSLQRIKDDVSLQVANAFLEAVSAQELVKVSLGQVESTTDQLELTKKLVEAGSLPRINKLELDAQLAQEKANLINAENSRDIAKLILAQLIMLTPAEFETFQLQAPNIDSYEAKALTLTPQLVFESALQNLAQIKEAELFIKASEYSLKATRASRYPSLGFQGFIGTGFSGIATESTGESQFLGFQPIGFVGGTNQEVLAPIIIPERREIPFGRQTNTNFNQAVTFSLNIPIFNRGQVNNQIRRSELDLERSKLNLDQNKLQLRQEVEQAYQQAIAAFNQLRAEEAATEAAKEAFELTEIRFNQQASNPVEFNQAKIRFAQSEANFIRAKYQYIFSVKVLEFYQGIVLQL
ncbi:MAG: TolC family protein [Luteibaculaceae bacterium]